MGDGNPYEQAPADAEGLSFTRIIDGQEITVTNDASYWAEGNGSTSKTAYVWDNYRYYDGKTTPIEFEERSGNAVTMTRYRLDGETQLNPEDDVAFMRWGNGWRMPTIDEWLQLQKYTKAVDAEAHDDETGRDGIAVYLTNDEILFFPYSSYYNGVNSSNPGMWEERNAKECYYWSSDLSNQTTRASDRLGETGGWVWTSDNPQVNVGWSLDALAWMPDFYYFSIGFGLDKNGKHRCNGYKVRPVKDKKNMPNDFPEWQDKQ